MPSSFAQMQHWGRTRFNGEKVVLRELLPSDLPVLCAWWNDSGEAIFQKQMISPRPAQSIEQMYEMWSTNDSPDGCGYSITAGGELVGHITLWALSMPIRIATCAIIIGPDFQNMGYGRDAMKVVLRIAFDEMGANKVEIQAWDYNERALHLYSSLGFIEEGRRRAATFHGGIFHDHVQMGILESEYRSLHSSPPSHMPSEGRQS